MKYKVISVLLAVLLLLSCMPVAASAESSTSLETIVNIMGALEIIAGDEQGNLNLDKYVTRAEFAKIVIAASPFKDSTSTNVTSSVFKDLPYSHWSAAYVKKAASMGYVYGYLDGTFRPNNTITLAETVSIVLKLLGYTAEDYTGAYPEGALNLYENLDLSKNVTAKGNDKMTRLNCLYLMYNVLNAKTKNGGVYCTTLGYMTNSKGEIDFASTIAQVVEGPIIIKDNSWQSKVPFNASSARVYKNEKLSTFSNITIYDVVYYSKALKTLWVYGNKVTGIIESITPNKLSPSSVVVGGNSYKLDSTASYQLSTFGDFAVGNSITLILGKEGTVLTAVSTSAALEPIYGIVLQSGTKSYTDGDNNSYGADYVMIAATDGMTYQYATTSEFKEGDLVSVTFGKDKISVAKMSPQKSFSGKVNGLGTQIGTKSFADNVQILDVSETSYISINPNRLQNVNLLSSDILFVKYNEAGELSHLILNDVTGDTKSYGLITEISANVNGKKIYIENTNNTTNIEYDGQFYSATAANITYTYLVNGEKRTHTNMNTIYGNISKGDTVAISSNGATGQIYKMTKLIGVDLLSFTEVTATSTKKSYPMANSVAYYECRDGEYYASSYNIVSDTSKYNLKGYYDSSISRGGRIRIVVASAK